MRRWQQDEGGSTGEGGSKMKVAARRWQHRRRWQQEEARGRLTLQPDSKQYAADIHTSGGQAVSLAKPLTRVVKLQATEAIGTATVAVLLRVRVDQI
jgi:hypothetical protein